MMHFRLASLVAVSALGFTLSGAAGAQPAAGDTNTENNPVQTLATAPAGPIAVNWTFHKGTGSANLTVNSDGTYLFSGQYTGHKANKDFDIVLALKASTGALLFFHFTGDAGNGVQWSKQGQSYILRDDFAQFANHPSWTAEYHFSETAEGRRKQYEAREKKREEIRKKEEEAERRHDKKVEDEQKALRHQLEVEELQIEQLAAQQHQGSTSSAFGDVINAVVGGPIGAIGGALASIF
jgi:hypothetical protein